MSRTLLDISSRAGDKNIGETLLRLARLAEAAHRHRVAEAVRRHPLDGKRRVEGLDPRVVAAPPLTDDRGASSIHTEVDQ